LINEIVFRPNIGTYIIGMCALCSKYKKIHLGDVLGHFRIFWAILFFAKPSGHTVSKTKKGFLSWPQKSTYPPSEKSQNALQDLSVIGLLHLRNLCLTVSICSKQFCIIQFGPEKTKVRSCTYVYQGCQIFLDTINQNGEKYQIGTT
jgi:hypothetical protein